MEPNLANATDRQLLQTYVCDGSQDAFGTLVHRYVDLVYSTSLRRVHDSHLAEDVAQAVFFILSKKAAKLSPQIVLPGWLYQTARRVSSDAIKMNTRRQHHEQAVATMQQTTTREPPSWDEISPHLESAIDRLGRKDREALLLRFFKGFSVQETANALSIPPNTASKRINRALEKLRAQLVAGGLNMPSAVISAAIASNAAQSAPASLSSAISATSFSPQVVELAKRALAAGKYAAMACASAATSIVVICLIAIAGPHVVSSAPPQTSKSVAAPAAPATTRATTAHPLGPVSPQHEQQIHLAIYRINHSGITVEGDKWAATIKELSEIGPPAVPELVAELDRTSRDSTLRAFGFILRTIGDARACPALARALARTSVLSSDFGGPLRQDSEVDQFIYEHQINGPRGAMTGYGRAIREIAAALETITHHQEGHSWDIDANNDTSTQRKAAQARHEAFSKRWQTWWDAHQREFVSDAELRTLITHPHDESAIEAVGVAAYGPEFPTGKPYHLGPVHEVALHSGPYDVAELIDFDAQAVMSRFDACRIVPPDTTSNRKDRRSMWFSSDGAGADASCAHMNTIGGKDLYTLYGQELRVWPIDDSRWESFEAEIATGQPIALDPNGPYSNLDYHDPQSHKTLPDHFPATSLFRTREGGAGIVQLLESDVANKAVHFRYRMVEPHPMGFIPRQPATLPTAPPFGASHTITLSVPSANVPCAIDLVSGKLFKAPEEELQDTQDPLKWVRLVHADIVTMVYSQPTRPAGLRAPETAFILVSREAWDNLSLSPLTLALNHSEDNTVPYLIAPTPNQKQDFTGTAMFRTAKPVSGLIQITNTTDDPPTVTFRYKLIGVPATQPAH